MKRMLVLTALALGCAEDVRTGTDGGLANPGANTEAGTLDASDLDGGAEASRGPEHANGEPDSESKPALESGSAAAGDGGSMSSLDPDCIRDRRQLLYETPDPSRAFFNPNEIYLVGSLPYVSCAVAPVSEPNLPLFGFGPCLIDAWVIRPSDRRLLYLDRDAGQVRTFACDGCTYAHPQDLSPANALANDETVPTPGCMGEERVTNFLLSPEGRVIHRCGARWLDERGRALSFAGNPAKFGYDGWLLLQSSLHSLSTGMSVPITGLPANAKWIAQRATNTGFWLAIALSDANEPTELWHVAFDGAASRQGVYPAPPTGANISFLLPDYSAFDSSGRLNQLTNNVPRQIIRRSIEGASEIVYDERTGPLLSAFSSRLVTGPGAAIAETRVWGGELTEAKCKTPVELWTYAPAHKPPPARPAPTPIAAPQPGVGVVCRGTRCETGQSCCERTRLSAWEDAGTAECRAQDAGVLQACSPFELGAACDQSSDCPASSDPSQPNVCCFERRVSSILDSEARPYNRVCTTAAACAGSAFRDVSSPTFRAYTGVLACQTDADCALAGPASRCVNDGLVTGPLASSPYIGRCEGTVKPPDGTTLLGASLRCGDATCSREDHQLCCHRGTQEYFAKGVVTMEAPTCERECAESDHMTRYAVPSVCDDAADCADPLAAQPGDPFVCCFTQDVRSGLPWQRQCTRRTQCRLFSCQSDADCVEAGPNFKCRPERTLTGGGKPRPEVRSCQDR